MRDITWIGANLRYEDRREIMCQLPDGVTGSAMAASVFASVPADMTWIASVKGQPVAAFGFHPLSVPVWQAWAWGTRQLPRAIPAITRHCWAQEDRLLALGARRLEARTIEGHHQAHRWLERLGCKRICELPDHGRNGETFYLFAWAIGDGRPSQRHLYRTDRNVLQHEDPQDPEADPATEPAVEDGG